MGITTAQTSRGIFVPSLGDDVVVTPYGNETGLPVFVQPVDPSPASDPATAARWVEENRAALDALLLKHGAYVLRGFSVPATRSFIELISCYADGDMNYDGGAAPRARIEGKILESTQAPPGLVLGMHQEMSYLPSYPGHIAFYCRTPSVSGGETLLADMRRYTAGLPEAFRTELQARGVLYTRNFRAPQSSIGHPALDVYHKSWTATFSTLDKGEAIAKVEAMGMQGEWLDDGSLSVAYRATGFVVHPVTRETISFNQIPAQAMIRANTAFPYDLYRQYYGSSRPLPYHPTFGDGTEIEEGHITAMYDLVDGLTVAFPWSYGDVLVIDNLLTAHGRNAFTGRRDVQVALLK